MDKIDFLTALAKRLKGLPEDDIDRSVDFYSEMIDDIIEDGNTEEEAVASLGDIDTIVAQIIADTPLTKILKEKIKPKRRLGAFEIILLILGSPIWLSLLIAVFAVIISLYASLWSIIILLWAVFGSLVGCTSAGSQRRSFFSPWETSPSECLWSPQAWSAQGCRSLCSSAVKQQPRAYCSLPKNVHAE